MQYMLIKIKFKQLKNIFVDQNPITNKYKLKELMN